MPLNPIAEGLWCLEGTFGSKWLTGSVRMTVLAGEDGVGGGLVLHSPVALAAEDVHAIKALGPVAAIVAPNLFHHLYLREAAGAFPEARVFVPHGLEAKIGPIPRAEVMTRVTPPTLPGGIESMLVQGHKANETVLFHRPSHTLVTADLIYNYQRENRTGEKLIFGLLGCYGAPRVVFYQRFILTDKAGIHALLAQVREWAPQRIVMGHGRIVESDHAAAVFAEAWRRLAGE